VHLWHPGWNFATDVASPSIRVFYAILPPPSLQQALGQLAQAVALRVHGRAVQGGNAHLTLAFVGAWPASRLVSLHTAGDAVRGEPFRLTLDTLGAFRRSGIAWLGSSHPPPQLVRLANALGDALREHDVTYDAHLFRPHVTLARRARGPGPSDRVEPFAWEVDAFSLMASRTRPEGVQYETLKTWPLRA
jgi:RNA 2',3'-cyclic 3'-phosphodiesterase